MPTNSLSRWLEFRRFAATIKLHAARSFPACLNHATPTWSLPIKTGIRCAPPYRQAVRWPVRKVYITLGASFTLVGSSGMVLLRYPDGADWIGKSIFSEGMEQSIASRDTEKTIEAAGPDGIRRLFAFSRLKNPVGGQTVYAAIDLPAALAFAKTREILNQNLIALGVLSAIILSLAWFGVDVFVLRQIRDIIAATNKVAAGNL